MKITSKYLILPVSDHAAETQVFFCDENGKPVYTFYSYLAPLNPERYMYLNVERFRGREFSVVTEPVLEIAFAQTETRPMDGVYDSYLRPTVHFSPAYGWTNDPNGMVYHNGTYHLFFQHNPAGTRWDNMHWGHATSPDMLHWTEQDIALFPDELGAPFSGSAIVDKNNVSGLSEDGNTIFLYYSAAGKYFYGLSRNDDYTQCIAYTKDGGKTFVKYEKNPILPNYVEYNRDPKVIWCEELDAYIMLLYMNGPTFRFFESKNLLDWTILQDMVIKEGVIECPDIYPLEADGEKKWVICGGNDIYRVGYFDRETRRFVAETDPKTFHYGTHSFAAQTFSDLPARKVRMAWNTFRTDGTLFGCQMGVPCEMSLAKINGEYWLKGVPVSELDTLAVKTDSYRGSTEAPLSKTEAHDITVKAPRDGEDFEITLFGETFIVKPKENVMIYGEKEVPLSVSGGDVEIRMITDTLTVECFLDGGFCYAVFGGVLDKSQNKLNVNCDAAQITVKILENIHK